MSEIYISDRVYKDIVGKILEFGVCGHRADIVMKETVKAVAAFRGHSRITNDDIEEAAYFVLPHRLKRTMEQQSEVTSDNNDKKEEDM